MELPKKLILEGIVLGILVVIGIIGMILWYGPFYNLGSFLDVLAVYGSASILHFIFIVLFVYWLWRVYKVKRYGI